MNNFYLPTSPASTATLSNEVIYRIPVQPINATIGATIFTSYVESRVTEQARALLPSISDRQMAQAVKNLIDTIDEVVYAFVAAGGNIDALSPLRASLPEDGSVSLEWISPDFRLGFNIEPNPDDSGWYIVTSKRLDEIGAYGVLSGLNSRGLIDLVLNFVLSNS